MQASTIRNPFPDLRQAKDSVLRIASLRRDLMIIDAELAAKRQARRAIFGAIAAVCLLHATLLGLFWLTMQLRDAGWSPWAIALLSFAVFGALTAVFGLLAYRAGFPTPAAAASAAVRKEPA